jgi:hypothetical protein
MIANQQRGEYDSRSNRRFQVNWTDIDILLKDVRVQVSYRKSRSFPFGELTEKPLSELKYNLIDHFLNLFFSYRAEVNGRKISLVQFFKEKYKITIQHPDWPAVIPFTPKNDSSEAFPIETLIMMVCKKH